MSSENSFLTSITITRNNLTTFENTIKTVLQTNSSLVSFEDGMFTFDSNNTNYGIKVLNNWCGLALYNNGELIGSKGRTLTNDTRFSIGKTIKVTFIIS